MSRPANLPAALQAWATGTYGAGPSWGGTAQRSAPGAAFLTPGVTLPAEVENYLHGNAFDTAQALLNFVGQLPAQNWPNVQTTDLSAGPSYWGTGDSAWDSKRSQWLSLLYGTVNFALYSSKNGAKWTAVGAAIGGTTTSGASVVYDPVADRYYATYSANIADYNAGTSTWTTGIATGALFGFSTAQWFSAKGVFIGKDSTTTKVGTYTNAAGWTTRTAPANSAAYNSKWKSAQGAGIILAIPNGITGANTYVMTTADGITWAEYQFATLAGETISDVAFGNGFFLVTVQTATDTKIYRSSTGLSGSWTLVKTITGTKLDTLCALGSLWLASFGAAATVPKALCSVDNGSTWGEAYGFGERLTDQPWRIFSNGQQFLTKTTVLVTAAAGAASSMGSQIVGLPTMT